MRRSWWLWVLALCLLPPRAGAGTHVRRALLVAVSGYDHRRGPDLDVPELSTQPDVDALRQVLTSPRYAFTDVVVLSTPAETTRHAIVAAFEQLIARTQPGDVVVFHYSGHGSVRDDPQDMQFGRDRTIVPSDYVSRTDRSNDLSDKAFKRLLDRLQARRPGSVLLTFDSCHSAAMTRGRGRVRGFDSGVSNTAQGSGLMESVDRPGFTAISACRYDEVDSEMPDVEMGSLSYALCSALISLSGSDVTYRDLFDQITCIMKQAGLSQQPQLEGSADRLLFGTRTRPRRAAILVAVKDDGQIWLQAGQIQGVAPGTEVALSPRGTGTVTRVEATESLLKVSGVDAKRLVGATAVITKRTYASAPLTVETSDPAPLQALIASQMVAVRPGGAYHVQTLAAAVRGQISSEPLPNGLYRTTVTRGTGSSLVLLGRNPNDGASLVMTRRDDGSFVTFPCGSSIIGAGDDVGAQVREALRRESRARLLTALVGSGHSAGAVTARLIPCQVQQQVWQADRPAGDRRLHVGEHFRVEVKNDGKQALYVTILDLQSDGELAPLWPVAAESNLVPGGSNWRPIYNTDVSGLTPSEQPRHYLTYRVTPPTGQDTYITIATAEPLRLDGLTDRDTRTPLQRLLLDAVNGTRGGDAAVDADQPWSATATHLTIVP